ncbi:MAG: hypothetical protein KUG59_06420, partial [Parvibaculaceae bacterium]|nr:hypothetical protein [Parvibaculaceae bacterium]
LVRYLFEFLNEFTHQHPSNRMDERGVAIVMGPNSARIEPLTPLQISDVHQS